MTTIHLPLLCLTLLPPWPQAILYAGKRLENRTAGVAAQIGGYRGLVGLTQSKAGLDDAVIPAEFEACAIEHEHKLGGSVLGRRDQWKKTAGKLFIVADLIRIDRPHEARGNAWHVPGQHGLIFGKVWEVEPLPARGGQGAWEPSWCGICHSISARHKTMKCATCNTGAEYNTLGERPQLRIVREVLP